MTKETLMGAVKSVQHSLAKHSPEILTGIGIAGMLTTAVLAVKATPKALQLIEEAKRENRKDELTPIETVKATWKCYIPAAATAITSTVCLAGASSVHLKRNAAIGAAYELSKTALKEYSAKVVETVGEETEHKIREKVDKERLENNPASKGEVIITGNGDELVYDSLSGRYFKASPVNIERAINQLNKDLLRDMYVSLNEFYDELDLDHTDLGDSLGWKLDDGLVTVYFTSQLTDDNRPCIVMNYGVAPRYDFHKLA